MIAIWSSEKLSHFSLFVQTANALKTDSRLVARQILAEYGQEVAAKEKKKKPKKNQDILELKVMMLSSFLLYICASDI
jgi:ribonuclease HI